MKNKAMVFMLLMMAVAGMSYAANDQAAVPASPGAQAGEAAREVKDTADESFKTGASKIGEASRKMEADAKETLKVLQAQWDDLAKQLQAKTRQIQAQLEQQWQDFNKSFSKPKP
jgi:flagellar motility protein MotE (MotC chaperone)